MKSEGQELRRRREIELKKRDRARLRELAERLKLARRARPVRIREIRGFCRLARQNVRAKIAELRQETLTRLRETAAQLREQQRSQCVNGEVRARAELAAALDQVHQELDEARRLFRSTYGRKGGKVSSRQRSKERREESDDEVRRNLPPELVPVFESVRQDIKAGPRRSRTEAFLEWVEENAEDAHAIVYEAIDRDVEKMIAEHQAVSDRLRKTRGAYDDEESQADALVSGSDIVARPRSSSSSRTRTVKAARPQQSPDLRKFAAKAKAVLRAVEEYSTTGGGDELDHEKQLDKLYRGRDALKDLHRKLQLGGDDYGKEADPVAQELLDRVKVAVSEARARGAAARAETRDRELTDLDARIRDRRNEERDRQIRSGLRDPHGIPF